MKTVNEKDAAYPPDFACHSFKPLKEEREDTDSRMLRSRGCLPILE